MIWTLLEALGEAMMRIHKITTETPDERRGWWKESARPKDPYRYDRVPQDDKGKLMSTFLKEKNGLPSTLKGTAFIEGNPSGHVFTAAEKKGNNGGRATKDLTQKIKKGLGLN